MAVGIAGFCGLGLSDHSSVHKEGNKGYIYDGGEEHIASGRGRRSTLGGPSKVIDGVESMQNRNSRLFQC